VANVEAVVMASVLLIVMANPASTLPEALSFTWMLKEKVPASVGVPEMAPLRSSNDIPGGSCPLTTVQM
jgi:hypothetical protein